MPKIDYASLWKNKAEGAPKKSVIGGLQKLLNEKEDQIIQMNAQIEGLKGRILETNDIMDQMEQKFIQQENQIKSLQSGGSGGYLTPSQPEIRSIDNSSQVDKLKNQLREMENKLFLFSNLPTRITDLEAKLEEKSKALEDSFETQEKLKTTVRKLSAEGGAGEIIADLQNKLKNAQEIIQNRQTQGASMNLGGSGDAQLRNQLIQLTDEKNRLNSQLNLFVTRNQELQSKLDVTQRTIQALQTGEAARTGESNVEFNSKLSQLQAAVDAKDRLIAQLRQKIDSGVDGPKVSVPKINPIPSPQQSQELTSLRSENLNLQNQVSTLEDKLRQEQMKIEEIVESVQKSSAGKTDYQQENIQLKNQLSSTQRELADVKQELASKESFVNMSGAELVNELNLKISRLKAHNKELEEKVNSQSSPSSLKPSAPMIRPIGGMDKEKEQEFNRQIAELRKQVAEKDAQTAQLNQDLIESQTQLAEMKAAGPQDGGSNNMMSLMQDLQKKIRKLKEQLRKKDEEIEALKK